MYRERGEHGGGQVLSEGESVSGSPHVWEWTCVNVGVSGHLTVDARTKGGPMGQSWQGSPHGQLLSWVVLATWELWVHYFGRSTGSSLGRCCGEQPWPNAPNHDLSCPDGGSALPSPHAQPHHCDNKASRCTDLPLPPGVPDQAPLDNQPTSKNSIPCPTTTNLHPRSKLQSSSAKMYGPAIVPLCPWSYCHNPKPPNSQSWCHPSHNALDLAPLEDMTHCCNLVLQYQPQQHKTNTNR